MDSLPPVFAVFRRKLGVFNILQTVEDENGNYLRLKQWSRPDAEYWASASSEEQIELMPFMVGQEWYIHKDPSDTRAEADVNVVTIHNQEYKYVDTGYQLIWSNYMTHKGRKNFTEGEWNRAPSIPILEFNTVRIYPRELLNVEVRWCDVSVSEILMVQLAARELLYEAPEEGEIQEDEDVVASNSASFMRSRTWSDFSDIMDDDIEDRVFDSTMKGFAIIVLSFMALLFVIVTLFMIVNPA